MLQACFVARLPLLGRSSIGGPRAEAPPNPSAPAEIAMLAYSNSSGANASMKLSLKISQDSDATVVWIETRARKPLSLAHSRFYAIFGDRHPVPVSNPVYNLTQ